MNVSKLLRPQYSLCTLLVFTTGVGLFAAWIARAEQQRHAVIALRKLDKYQDVAFYSFYGEGPCAGVVGPEYEPNWLARTIGLDLFYGVTNVCLDAERLEEAMPHLRRLSSLREVYVSADHDDETSDASSKGARIDAAIKRLQKEFPGVKVEAYPGCPILTSKIPVVG